jgi:hypothetical protein
MKNFYRVGRKAVYSSLYMEEKLLTLIKNRLNTLNDNTLKYLVIMLKLELSSTSKTNRNGLINVLAEF